MNNPAYSAIQTLLNSLSAASDGLFYISESDYPFEVVHFPDVQDNSRLPAAILQQAGLPEDAAVEVVDLPYFFRNMTREPEDAGEEEINTARRFQELQALVEQQLEEVKVYKVGKRRIQAYILGKLATGDYAGLKTTVVET